MKNAPFFKGYHKPGSDVIGSYIAAQVGTAEGPYTVMHDGNHIEYLQAECYELLEIIEAMDPKKTDWCDKRRKQITTVLGNSSEHMEYLTEKYGVEPCVKIKGPTKAAKAAYKRDEKKKKGKKIGGDKK